jgi:iron complex transport system substrate-binding protein
VAVSLRAAAAVLLLALGSALAPASARAGVAITDDRGRRVELPAPPQRVVSLLPSLTETVCALQALKGCERLVGVDRFSSWPAQVRLLPQLGGLEDTQVERLLALKPDLVLASGSSRAIDRLEALGLRVAALDHKSLQDTERVIVAVARLLGDEAAGVALWRDMQRRIEAAAARVPAALRGQRVYFEVASTPYAAGSVSFIGQMLAQLGLANIVPASMGPFPQLNPEFIVRAQPDLVFASARALEEMPRRPGWAALRALRERQACGFSPERWDVLVRPGPRLGEAAEFMADCLRTLPQPAPAR